jgi:hypothetical protein
MAVFRWNAPTNWVEVIANATFGTTPDGGFIDGTIAFDNSGSGVGLRGIEIEFELQLTSLAVPATGIRAMEVFARALGSDAVTYEDRALACRLGQIVVTNGTSAKLARFRTGILPVNYRFSLGNRLGASIVAGTNSLRARVHALADV